MLDKEVKKWLTECKCVSHEAIGAFASTLVSNEQLILGLYALFDTPPYHAQVFCYLICTELDPVCHQLYEFYRSNEKALKQFSLQFSSVLIWLYLQCLSQGDTEVCGGVETFLLGIYNLEIVKLDGSPVVESVCIPTINKTSVYHESRGAWEPLTERALHSLSPCHATTRYGPFPQYERVSARNRFIILSYIMQHYNVNIDSFHTYSLDVLCQVTIKLSSTGFNISQDSGSHHEPRIDINPPLLMEFLFAVYFALFNGHHQAAMEAFQAVHTRSSFELYSDILLVTGAVLNSYCYGNLQFDITHANLGAQKTAQVLKNLVTNASFKAKKLPDDIDIVEEVQQRLPAIMEDQEYSLAKGLRTRLMNLGGKLSGDRNKNRDSLRQDGDISSPKQASKGEFSDSASGSGHSPGSSGDGRDASEPQRSKGGSRNGGDKNNAHGSDVHGKTNEEKHVKISTATIVFSKKSGILRQVSLGSSGIGSKTTEASTKAPHSFTTSSQISSSSSLSTKSSSSTHNKSMSSHSNSNANNIAHSINKTHSSEFSHGNMSQSQTSRNESKLSSAASSSSSSALLQSSSNSFANNTHNSSEPLLGQLSSSNSQTPASAKSYSTFAETFLANRKRPSQKSANKSSLNTDL